MDTLTLCKPDDWHLHVRDGNALTTVVAHSARQFGRAIIMPNLQPPVITTAQAQAYRERILAAVPGDCRFEPLMTLYLTDNTVPSEITTAQQSGTVHAVKLYPAGATTHSDAGVTDINKVSNVLAAMEKAGMPLLVHGEVTHPDVDIFDREKVFIDRVLSQVIRDFPGLKVVLEHITTADGIQFVQACNHNVGGTITPHHLLMNRNAMFAGGIRPHHYCLPVLKREQHRQALLAAATSGDPRFFLGTDSAPHPKGQKESGCGCAGIYSAHAALALYAEAFDSVGALDKLEGFASFHGADFYGLPRNTGHITLVKQSQTIPDDYALGNERLVPLRAGESVAWSVQY
jgi:dihydroorotase